MKTIKLFRLFSFIPLCTLAIFFAGCASMYIRGSNSVQRAVSAAELIIEGNTSDDYIKVYKAEIAKAESDIIDMIQKAERNNIYYADIADTIADWLLLYKRVVTLQKMYPNGLSGKKTFVVFEAADYSDFKDEVYIKAAEALYNEAEHLAQISGNDTEKAERALGYLKRAKKYSHHLDNEIHSLGAQIAYNAAESLSYTNKPDNLLQASEYYMLAHSWVPGYRNSFEKAQTAKEKAAYFYFEEGNYNLQLKDYSAFRHAKASYQKAEKIIPGIALRELAEVNRLLTIKMAIVVTENTYSYEDRIKRAINEELGFAKSGPAIIDITFIRQSGRYFFDFMDIKNADLVFLPADTYGKVKEIYGPVITSNKNISKTVNGILYTGVITEQSQIVSVYAQNDFILYDIRSWRKKELCYFTNETNKISKNFTVRYYSGNPEAKPENFNPGFLYEAGQYNKFFPEVLNANNSIQLITNYGSLTSIGKELCNEIKNLNYVEK